MTSMVERVARALHDVQDPVAYGWDELFEQHRLHLMDQARAAIAALREPTLDMYVAGDEGILEHLQDHTFALKEPTSAVTCWQAMCDSALSDT